MTITQASVRRDWAGKAGALFCILLFLSLLDACLARFREPLDHLSCLPGETMAVTGPLDAKVGNLQELTYLSNSKGLHLVFDLVETGFWLGGYMWRGRILISREIQPGQYKLAVPTQRDAKGKSAFIFQVEVFKNELSRRQASPSFIHRYLGISPWKTALFLVPFILLTFGTVFFLSQKAEVLLAQEGKAEIYRVLPGEFGCRIFFGLGKNQGLLPGASLALFNEQKKLVGRATVQEVFEGYSIAQTGLESSVMPGFIVSRS